MKSPTLQFFKEEHFIEPICVGELKYLLDRVTRTANEVLERDFVDALDEFYLTLKKPHLAGSPQDTLLRISADLRTISLIAANLNSEIKILNQRLQKSQRAEP